jgi:23S rRNA (adenine2030-N6)-methyltransferase
MNYLHTYHAGNFADVFKHVVLIALLKSLSKKEKPFFYLDTHAGTGVYDLFSLAAQKSKESESGIEKIIQQKKRPPLIKDYLECVYATNPLKIPEIRFYPGSPAIAHYFLRSHDRMALTELHPKEYRVLEKHFSKPHIQTKCMDGYTALKAFLPPTERRGLILIDPPYENPNEHRDLLEGLKLALKRFETGVYAVWYPIKDRTSLERFYGTLQKNITLPMMAVELSIYPETTPTHLNGSGMIIINPPWQLDQTLAEVMPWLWETLSPPKQGQWQVTML